MIFASNMKIQAPASYSDFEYEDHKDDEYLSN
jgi:hypothetical protein